MSRRGCRSGPCRGGDRNRRVVTGRRSGSRRRRLNRLVLNRTVIPVVATQTAVEVTGQVCGFRRGRDRNGSGRLVQPVLVRCRAGRDQRDGGGVDGVGDGTAARTAGRGLRYVLGVGADDVVRIRVEDVMRPVGPLDEVALDNRVVDVGVLLADSVFAGVDDGVVADLDATEDR